MPTPTRRSGRTRRVRPVDVEPEDDLFGPVVDRDPRPWTYDVGDPPAEGEVEAIWRAEGASAGAR